MQARTFAHPRSRSRGLSLIEILVGVAIGLIGTVAIFQAVAVWSKHTATTTSGGDAQVAGTLALYNIERDVKQAGHGFGRAVTQVMGCAVAATDTTPGPAVNSLRPVAIAASAVIRIYRYILYGNSSLYVGEGAFTDATASTNNLNRRGVF
jgi:type IV pilus assembly protein PilW